MPKVSVIIPCYNAEKYLRQCLDSAVNQTLQDIEIICVDDGSTDSTVTVLRDYESRDQRIKVLCQQNKFAGVARNAGISIATGEFLSFLDADDYYEIDGLEKAYALAHDNHLDMLKLSSYLLDDRTGEISTNSHYSHGNISPKWEAVAFQDAPNKLLSCVDVAWNGLYSREFIIDNQICFNDFRCVNDRSFFISCLVRAHRIMVADTYLTYYRQNIRDSLVSIRHKYFACQIDSYNLVKQIVNSANIEQINKRLILQRELNQIFIWYEKFLASGINTFYVEAIIRKFVASYDPADVGGEYLTKFPYRKHFIRFQESLEIDWEKEKHPDTPAISIIIPVHNSVKYLSECIESVLLQSLRDFELICVDDESTDASYELLHCFSEADYRIRLIHQSQAGAGVARNTGISAANGKYLVFIDSDDKIHRDYLQMLFTAAEKNNADVVVSPDIVWSGIGEGTPVRSRIADEKLPKGEVFSYASVPDYIMNFTDGAPHGKIFRRKFILENNLQFLPIRRSEDFYFVFGSITSASRVLRINESGYYYRKNNPASLEKTKDETPLLFWEATLRFKEKLMLMDYFDIIKRSYLNNTITRVFYNLKSVTSFQSFSLIFNKVKEIYSSELELDRHEKDFFYETDSYNYLLSLVQFPTAEDFLYSEYKKLLSRPQKKTKKTSAEIELADTYCSVSYRIGRTITFIPRKIRGGIRCMKQKGLKYTIKLFFQIVKAPFIK